MQSHAAPIDVDYSGALLRRTFCCGRPQTSGSPPGSPRHSSGSSSSYSLSPPDSPRPSRRIISQHDLAGARITPAPSQNTATENDGMGGWHTALSHTSAENQYLKVIRHDRTGQRRVSYVNVSTIPPKRNPNPPGRPGAPGPGPSGAGGSHQHGPPAGSSQYHSATSSSSGYTSSSSSASSSPVRDPRRGKGPASSSRH